MQNIKLILEYDGTGYVGWQLQPNGSSLQEELERALRQILQEEVGTVAAGRTDAGVHARGQVVSFTTAKNPELTALVKSLNGLLPPQMVVLSGEFADPSFHARYSATARIYRYYLALRATAIERDFSWYVGGFNIDSELLSRCSEQLLGEHDFGAFCKSNSDVEHHRCIVEVARWDREGSQLVFTIRANRFLYGMVRALVGTMVEVGRGHRTLEEFSTILDSRDRKMAGMAAPAKGLFLEEIVYDRRKRET